MRSIEPYVWLMTHPKGMVPIIISERRIDKGRDAAADLQVTREHWRLVFLAAQGELHLEKNLVAVSLSLLVRSQSQKL